MEGFVFRFLKNGSRLGGRDDKEGFMFHLTHNERMALLFLAAVVLVLAQGRVLNKISQPQVMNSVEVNP